MDESQYGAIMAELHAIRGDNGNGNRVSLAILDTKLNQLAREREGDRQRVDDLERCRLDDVQRVTRMEAKLSSLAVGQSIFTGIAAALAAWVGSR